ncbi:MAG TPA: hypothetical protein EYP25_12265 [Anaerolineae bacterium]|nr:hypothetical protein [Anaerolineae bacterium]HIQ11625.1 hypothetical protein [Caldilineales bacterium]
MSRAAPPILLKPITTEALPDLQAMYEASPGYFATFTGEPASPLQAANDYHQLLDSDDRAIMAIWWEEERIIGSLDFRFHHPEEGVLWLGALILQDELPAERTEIGVWTLRILEEWLRIATDIHEIRTAVPFKAAAYVRFWQEAGYELTPELLRLPIRGKRIRFGVFRRSIPP